MKHTGIDKFFYRSIIVRCFYSTFIWKIFYICLHTTHGSAFFFIEDGKWRRLPITYVGFLCSHSNWYDRDFEMIQSIFFLFFQLKHVVHQFARWWKITLKKNYLTLDFSRSAIADVSIALHIQCIIAMQ